MDIEDDLLDFRRMVDADVERSRLAGWRSDPSVRGMTAVVANLAVPDPARRAHRALLKQPVSV